MISIESCQLLKGKFNSLAPSMRKNLVSSKSYMEGILQILRHFIMFFVYLFFIFILEKLHTEQRNFSCALIYTFHLSLKCMSSYSHANMQSTSLE